MSRSRVSVKGKEWRRKKMYAGNRKRQMLEDEGFTGVKPAYPPELTNRERMAMRRELREKRRAKQDDNSL